MNKTVLFSSVIFLFMTACNRSQEEQKPNLFSPKVVEAKGYVVPKDSMAEPKVVPAGKPNVVKAGKPEVVLTNTNVVAAGSPQEFRIGLPTVFTPGKDTILLPKSVPANGHTYTGGIPEVVVAKDPRIKDINPKNFSSFSKLQGLKHDIIQTIFQDQSGNMWFGTGGGGATRYDGNSFTHFTEKEGMPNNIVTDIKGDKNGNLWFSTWGGGVCRYDGKTFLQFTEKEGLSFNVVFDILLEKNGTLWFGTQNQGVCKYDGKSLTSYGKKEGFSNAYVMCSLQDRNGNLWFGTWDGLYRFDGKSFARYTQKEGLISDKISCLFEDHKGNLWIGAAYGGVSRFNGTTIAHFTMKEGLSNNYVQSILQDKSGCLWFGTKGGGVCRYDGKSFMVLTEKEGLCNNAVTSILEDKRGDFWFGTPSGLSRLSGDFMMKLARAYEDGNKEQPVIFKNYTYEDGFLGIGCFGRSILEDDKGTIWIGTTDRLTAYHPEGDKPDTLAPNIQLTGIQLFNENIAWLSIEMKKDTSLILGNGVTVKNVAFDSISHWYFLPMNLSLAWNNNYLTFNFIGITLKQSKKVAYQYKLEGLDENWSALTTRIEAPYGNIPPGSYTFKVKAMNSEGFWSKEFNYTFTIRPPWWKTWWAYAAYMLIILGGIGAVIYSILENQRKKIRLIINERNRIARELHDDIGAELTRITILSQFLQKNTHVEEEIRVKLRKISETGKKVLGSIGEIIWTMNPQKDNLDSLAAYIRRFVTEYLETNDIDLHIEFPNEIPANAISDEYRRNVFLVIKEAISNISKYSKATSVRLSLNIGEKLAEFEISDNGTGFSVKEKENWGNGLSNMNQRMKDIGGTFLIRSEINEGTFIRLTFPIR
jgi:ligand-binding sensor domain-containing protein